MREIIPQFVWHRQANVYQQSPCVSEASKPLERKKSTCVIAEVSNSTYASHEGTLSSLILSPANAIPTAQPLPPQVPTSGSPWPLLSHPHPITSLHPLHFHHTKLRLYFSATSSLPFSISVVRFPLSVLLDLFSQIWTCAVNLAKLVAKSYFFHRISPELWLLSSTEKSRFPVDYVYLYESYNIPLGI